MKETLIALEPELAKKSVAVEELMKNLAKEQKSADKVRVTVKADEENAKVRINKIFKYSSEISCETRPKRTKLKCWLTTLNGTLTLLYPLWRQPPKLWKL